MSDCVSFGRIDDGEDKKYQDQCCEGGEQAWIRHAQRLRLGQLSTNGKWRPTVTSGRPPLVRQILAVVRASQPAASLQTARRLRPLSRHARPPSIANDA